MAMVEYELKEHVAVLTMNNGENRFNPTYLGEFLDLLDEIENKTEATTLVVKSANEKIWCNGLDLDWLMPVVQAKDVETSKKFFYQLNDLFRRLLVYPLTTIAAINGHAFAGGAILTGAFDFRYMRTDRGFFCIPEVDISIPFLPGMMALLRNVMSNNVMHFMGLTGSRMTAQQCLDAKMVAGAYHIDEMMDKVMEFALTQNKRRQVAAAIKEEMHRDILYAINELDPPIIETGRLQV
ncbi:Enoyl-CoA hydratase/carnithine racemase [Desulfatibacillum alkenivorans DSM 16219]|jgi:enoyl-CoA hydratase/carnithine racemase|uniref:Enoyl-CoA hydratase/carnithine racemase n=1 Tax=Desulfatibacillum alkenivorans DSM 16219 TaxID=1121393 RepID=A0A1M6FN98_9BACT|nr:enoyl-CoA hydratase/isomerase family protein [Desulfatibacillum alkenivorans]SHI99157.1 Enoyl-CoA hydratase/carnithine racemase [Desulfatibacillum alkenivorans DSM 16219]